MTIYPCGKRILVKQLEEADWPEEAKPAEKLIVEPDAPDPPYSFGRIVGVGEAVDHVWSPGEVVMYRHHRRDEIGGNILLNEGEIEAYWE